MLIIDHIKGLLHPSTFELQQEPMRFILVLLIMFELQQEPMRFIPDFVLVRQPGLVELLFYVH